MPTQDEYEFRKIIPFKSLQDALKPLSNLNLQHIIFIYFDSFRIQIFNCGKPIVVEKKIRIKQQVIYHDKVWFRYVHSEEKPYDKFSGSDHVDFVNALGHKMHQTEHRYETYFFDKRVKLYAFQRDDERQCGIAFEFETNDPMKDLPLLSNYTQYTQLKGDFSDDTDDDIQRKYFSKCVLSRRRKLVQCYQKGNKNIDDESRILYAHKWDGIHGFVFTYCTYWFETWEDHVQACYKIDNNNNDDLCPGLILSAERLEDGTVVILDVVQMQGNELYRKDVRHILCHFLPHLATSPTLPSHVRVQHYASSVDTLPPPSLLVPHPLCDGLIIHTWNDRIFKSKPNYTVDLFYEKGFLKSFDEEFPVSYHLHLEDGCVYECDFDTWGESYRIIRVRHDRCVSNTHAQIEDIKNKKKKK